MRPFLDNFELVINKYFCSFHNSFPGIYYSSKYQMLSEMGIYNYSYNNVSIFFELAAFLNSNYN